MHPYIYFKRLYSIDSRRIKKIRALDYRVTIRMEFTCSWKAVSFYCWEKMPNNVNESFVINDNFLISAKFWLNGFREKNSIHCCYLEKFSTITIKILHKQKSVKSVAFLLKDLAPSNFFFIFFVVKFCTLNILFCADLFENY